MWAEMGIPHPCDDARSRIATLLEAKLYIVPHRRRGLLLFRRLVSCVALK